MIRKLNWYHVNVNEIVTSLNQTLEYFMRIECMYSQIHIFSLHFLLLKFYYKLEFPSKIFIYLFFQYKFDLTPIHTLAQTCPQSASYIFQSNKISTKKNNNNNNDKITNLKDWKSRVINEMMMKFITSLSSLND